MRLEFAVEGPLHDRADRSHSVDDTMVQSIRLQLGVMSVVLPR
jgi:hypothetical protein